MITIDLLKNHPEAIERLAIIFHEELGQTWEPDESIDDNIRYFSNNLNEDILPLTYVAFYKNQTVGMCSLVKYDGIKPDFIYKNESQNSEEFAWLGSLVVDHNYQKNGIGKLLIEAIKQKAKNMGLKTLYLFAFEQNIIDYYVRLGWAIIGMDQCKGHEVTVMQIVL